MMIVLNVVNVDCHQPGMSMPQETRVKGAKFLLVRRMTAAFTCTEQHFGEPHNKLLSISTAVMSLVPSPPPYNDWIPAPLKTHIFEAEVTTGASQPEPCETPLYAVVDKTKKKRNQRPTSIVDKEKQMEKEIKQGELVIINRSHYILIMC